MNLTNSVDVAQGFSPALALWRRQVGFAGADLKARATTSLAGKTV